KLWGIPVCATCLGDVSSFEVSISNPGLIGHAEICLYEYSLNANISKYTRPVNLNAYLKFLDFAELSDKLNSCIISLLPLTLVIVGTFRGYNK
ncbi:9968_t:CDS:1, partial [Acaulospora morrowiae]